MWREYTDKLLIATQGIRSNFLRKSKISNKQIWLLQCPYFMSPSQLSLRTFCCFLIILFHCRAWSLLLHRECFSCTRRFESVCGSWLLWIRNEGTGGFHAPLLRLFSLLEEKKNSQHLFTSGGLAHQISLDPEQLQKLRQNLYFYRRLQLWPIFTMTGSYERLCMFNPHDARFKTYNHVSIPKSRVFFSFCVFSYGLITIPVFWSLPWQYYYCFIQGQEEDTARAGIPAEV